ALPYTKGKTGVINIRLLQPFDERAFVEALPKNVKNITVLERNFNPNGQNPIYTNVLNAIYKNKLKITLLQGVYGLGGKEFSPDDAVAVFENMQGKQLTEFSVGINDDINNNSLEVKPLYVESNSEFKARIYGLGSDGSVSSAKSIIKILGQNSYAQGYFDYDSKKSGSLTISHIRTSNNPINKPFNSNQVDVVLCNNPSFLKKHNISSCLRNNGTLIINCSYTNNELNKTMLNETKLDITTKNIKVYTIDADKIALDNNLGNKINNIMQASLFYVSNIIPYNQALTEIENNINIMFSKKGEDVVNNNINAIKSVQKCVKLVDNSIFNECKFDEPAPQSIYYEQIIKPISKQDGNNIPVSKFKVDGHMPTDTAKFEKRGIANNIPCWHAESCIQCGRCSIACPHASLRPIIFEPNDKTPNTFTSKKAILADGQYRMQVEPMDCTGCGVCSQVCPMKGKAITMENDTKLKEIELINQQYAYTLPLNKPFEPNSVKGLQFYKPYFEYSGACAGCGETPYIKTLTQLFGDRMIIANATGCSSIYGGTFPTCPYTKDGLDLGPAWANSLFEDNAEFGYGIMLAKKHEREKFISTLKTIEFSTDVAKIINKFLKNPDNHKQNRKILEQLTLFSATRGISESDKYLFDNLGFIIKPSTWIIGGDGWAYDIGFGGLDHVIASGENINILVLDTEVYSNTGGQTSKATPRGASAKFNQTGKTTKKKDLASMMLAYKDVYVAQIAMGSNPDQAIQAFIEAENYNGPSLIIAYSPCVSHGYDLRYSQTHAFASVSSGYNTLFRYNPTSKQPMQIDSIAPFTDYNEYANSENRYKILDQVNPSNKQNLLTKSKQDAVNRRKALVNQTKK
ncbi:MAG: pyruvate:ferredoxin (flavodoxin) oxidoreductase, partial [Clostridia bacterium]